MTRHQRAYGIRGRDVPRLEYADLGHDLLREERGRRQVWQAVDLRHHRARRFELGGALSAFPYVGLERGNSKSNFLVYEEIEFIGQ